MAPHSISPYPQSEDPFIAYTEFAPSTPQTAPSEGNDGYKSEPIAIIGMACRLPGESSSPSKFWDLLEHGRSGQCKVPASRFNIDGFYKKDGDLLGRINMEGGYFLSEDIREFENDFFGINNVEATYMDPQQRKLLEVVFECFESAGAPLETISGSNTGCYVGNFTVDFPTMQTRDIDSMHRYSMAGMGTTILSNRISHAFNLNGPSMVLDTACSSGIYSLHTACTALETRDCDGAIVAAANLIQSIEQHVSVMKAGVLSKTSTCHSFDASADGYGRADAVGALYLKRLSDAIRDNDPIRAVIRGTAVNANGKTQGITLPSAMHQEKVIRKAYAKAGINIDGTSYVECHGTGTAVGDPIEVEAVSKVFKRSSHNPLLVGSVKTNVGHSEAASALSSIMKLSMAMEKGYIPPTIGVTRINPKIKSEEWGVKVVTEGQAWPELNAASAVRRCGINSFGYGGANGHAILDSASHHTPRGYGQASAETSTNRSTYILPLSGSSKDALDARVHDLAGYDFTKSTIQDLAYTLSCRRSHLQKRGYILTSGDSFHEVLTLENLQTSPKPVGQPPSQYAFVFTGQGAQWPQMGKELLKEFDVVRKAFSEMDSILQALPHPPSWSLKEAILEPKATSKIMLPEFSQPTCTAVQIALVLLLQSFGIMPAAVLGHSSGEIAAAFAAGFLTLAEAITIAYYRGYVVEKNELDGAMMAAGLSEADANETIDDLGLVGQIKVACVNSPESTTISGDSSGIDAMLKDLQGKQKFARKLQTNGRAYHSHHMQVLGDDYQSLLQNARALEPSTSIAEGAIWVSSVTGGIIQKKYVGPAYWRKNLENPVEFAQAVTRVAELGAYQIIELGPHSALELPIKQTRTSLGVSEDNLPYASALVRNKDAVECVLGMMGRLFLSGHQVALDKVNELDRAGKTSYKVIHDLPAYRWTYAESPLWHEPRISEDFRGRVYPRHELLGSLVPAGNGLEFNWKNLLRLDESPWLKDHKLEDSVVFPGAGYMCMAIEAVLQATQHQVNDRSTVHMKNFNILSALVLPKAQNAHTEMFTTLRPTPISGTTNSNEWWDVTILSTSDAGSTTHATGSLKVVYELQPLTPKFKAPPGTLEPSAPRVWYDKLNKKGLGFGPEFQTISDFSVSRMRNLKHCRAVVPMKQSINHEMYPLHPVTLDALLQTSIVAVTSGITEILAAKVPTRVGSAAFSLNLGLNKEPWSIDSNATTAGFGAAVINAELVRSDGLVKARIEDVRLAPFEGASQREVAGEERHPMLRVLWKPDISPGLVTPMNLSAYLQSSRTESGNIESQEYTADLTACLDLLGHKNPYLRILQLGDNTQFTSAALDTLHAQTSFPHLLSYTVGRIDENDQLFGSVIDLKSAESDMEEAFPSDLKFDVIVVSDTKASLQYFGEKIEVVKSRLAEGGNILAIAPADSSLFQGNELVAIDTPIGPEQLVLAHHKDDDRVGIVVFFGYLILVENYPSAFGDVVASQLQKTFGQAVKRISFDDISKETIPNGATVISLVECEPTSLLSTTTEEQLNRVKILTDEASSLVWVTAGNLLQGGVPDHALIFGLSRAVLMEQPSLRFFAYDVDDITRAPERTASNIVSVLKRVPAGIADFEYIERAGVAHISRFSPDEGLNEAFRQTRGTKTVDLPLDQAKPAQLAIKTPGQFDSIFFKQISLPELAPHEVQVAVKSVGLNAKDFYALGGRVDTKKSTCLLEFCGVVEKTGDDVTEFDVGDRVYVMAPSYFRTSETVPAWACSKLQDDEDFDTMATQLFVYATALYALQKANLQAGESILIHSGAGGVGIAAIQLAQLAGAEVFTTVSTAEKRTFLVQTFGIKRENIFTSRDASFEQALMEATNGQGVDVVLNSVTGDLLHASWRCCGEFGRFIDIGKKDLTDSGRLAMDQFLKNATYTAFDVSDLYNSNKPVHNQVWAELKTQALELYRQKKTVAIPLEVFDVSDLPNALRKFGSRNRIGKVAVNLERGDSVVRVEPARYATTFDGEKSYLMIGCLGGLGRSLSKWMVERGARKFVFLGRSGLDKPAARRLVEDLASLGAACKVVRGDVSSKSDVEEMVRQAESPIGGVIQGAMGLNHALFSVMPNEYWHTGIDPKVHGTWNIHNALKGKEDQLDFFLLTSSISGSVGTATECNYCAANYFLDNFARYRRSLGLKATAVGLGMISEVGYLHENPDIENLLLRKGIVQINESEMISIIDISLSKPLNIPRSYDSAAAAHVLTGLEPFGMLEIRKTGFKGSNPILKSSRAAILARAIHDADGSASSQSSGDLPPEVSEALKSGVSLPAAISDHVARRFGDLVLVAAEKVDRKRPLDNYGMDSMIAAEFRGWFYQAFKVDVPFLELLSKSTTVESLSAIVVEEAKKRSLTRRVSSVG